MAKSGRWRPSKSIVIGPKFKDNFRIGPKGRRKSTALDPKTPKKVERRILKKLAPRIADDLEPYLGKPCYYCGVEMIATSHRRPTRDHDLPRTFGGRVPGNIVICCFLCNRLKWSLSGKEFIAHCRAVAARHPP